MARLYRVQSAKRRKTKNKTKPKEKSHHKALPFSDVPEFMRELTEIDGMGAIELEF